MSMPHEPATETWPSVLYGCREIRSVVEEGVETTITDVRFSDSVKRKLPWREFFTTKKLLS